MKKIIGVFQNSEDFHNFNQIAKDFGLDEKQITFYKKENHPNPINLHTELSIPKKREKEYLRYYKDGNFIWSANLTKNEIPFYQFLIENSNAKNIDIF